jgi:hypothetical protein
MHVRALSPASPHRTSGTQAVGLLLDGATRPLRGISSISIYEHPPEYQSGCWIAQHPWRMTFGRSPAWYGRTVSLNIVEIIQKFSENISRVKFSRQTFHLNGPHQQFYQFGLVSNSHNFVKYM